MAKETKLGKNRTGMQMSPKDSKELLEGSQRSTPDPAGDATALARMRRPYLEEADPLGSVPPPGTLKGMAKSGVDMVTGNRPHVLIDKLGERLAFERGGTRLYEALMQKCEVRADEGKGVIDAGKLREIHREEARHFELVREAIEKLGGDPTAQTPAADVVGVQSAGLVQSITDPRTTVAQSLSSILIAELADNAGWELLITLSREAGHDDLAKKFEGALAAERTHLTTVQGWLEQLTLAEAKLVSA